MRRLARPDRLIQALPAHGESVGSVVGNGTPSARDWEPCSCAPRLLPDLGPDRQCVVRYLDGSIRVEVVAR